MNTMIFTNIPAIINRDIVMRRLGYQRNTTLINPKQRIFFDKSIDLGLSLCDIKGIMGRLKIIERTENFIIIKNEIKSLEINYKDYSFTTPCMNHMKGPQIIPNNLFQATKIYSRSFASLLKNSNEVLLIAATAGRDVVDRILLEVDNGDAALGVIMDSVASVAADASVTWIKDFADKMVRREGKRVTRHRYSPGFKGFSLSYQKTIFEILQLQEIGLSLTEKFMLVPEKSVIAVAGIEMNEDKE